MDGSARACDSSARFKTTNRQFSHGKITLLAIQLEPVTVQQDLRQPVDSKITLQMVQLEHVTVQQDSRPAVDSSARVKSLYIWTVQQCSRQVVNSSVRNYSPSRQFSYI